MATKNTAYNDTFGNIVCSSLTIKSTAKNPLVIIDAMTNRPIGGISGNGVLNGSLPDGSIDLANLGSDAASAIATAVSAANGKNTNYEGDNPPANPIEGDNWFQPVKDSSGNIEGYQTNWYDGTQWVNLDDYVANAAQIAAEGAQATANGKNKIYYSATAPTGTFTVGDLWFNTSNDNEMSTWNGSSWASKQLGNLAISNIDAGKITTGTLSSLRLSSDVITVNNLYAIHITADQITSGTIDAALLDGVTLVAGNIEGNINGDAVNVLSTLNIEAGINMNYGHYTSSAITFGLYTSYGPACEIYANNTGGIRLLYEADNHYFMCANGQGIEVDGYLSMVGTSYPQIFGNGSTLQLANMNNATAGVVITSGYFRPAADNQLNLGASTQRWAQIYSTNSAISTSDRNEKNSIVSLDDKAVDLIMKLNPVSYKFNSGTSGRKHYGMIAQDIESTMNDLGMASTDFAGFIKTPMTTEVVSPDGKTKTEQPTGEYRYGLRYEEFIAPLIKTVQQLNKRVTALEAR